MGNNKQKVFLINEKEGPDSFFSENINSGLKWIYLGRNVRLCTDLDKKYYYKIPRILIAQTLQETAKEYRQEYIDFIGRQASSNDESWWLTAVSERNNYISNVFLYACYLKVVTEYINRNEEGLIVVCESGELLEILSEYCEGNNFCCNKPDSGKRNPNIINITYILQYFLSKFIFVFKYICRLLISRFYSLIRRPGMDLSPDPGYYVLQTWVDSRFFYNENSYFDVFFGKLYSFLKENNRNPIYILDVLPNIFYPKAVSKLLDLKEPFILRENYFGILDILRSVLYANRKLRKINISGVLMGFDIKNIIYQEIRQEMLGSRAEQSYLVYVSTRNISGKFRIEKYAYPFENHMWEKMLIRSIRETSKSTEIIAYAHPVVNLMYTCYSVSKFEKEVIPLPDRIITNGKLAKNVLIESGFDADRIFTGCALRFDESYNGRHYLDNGDGEKKILLACSANITETTEMIYKSISAFGSLENLKVLIKLHPNVKKSVITGIGLMLPGNFEFVEESMDSLLSKSSAVLCTSSSVCVESVIKGVPVVHIKSDYTIDMNAFENYDVFESVSTPDELKQVAIDILGDNLSITDDMREIAESHFYKVSKEKLSVFL